MNKTFIREAVKIEKIKKVWNFFTGVGGFKVIFTLFISCLKWPIYNGLIRREMQRKIFISTYLFFLFWQLPSARRFLVEENLQTSRDEMKVLLYCYLRPDFLINNSVFNLEIKTKINLSAIPETIRDINYKTNIKFPFWTFCEESEKLQYYCQASVLD